MGHGTNDKLFITPSEHSGVYGQHGATTGARRAGPSVIVPFHMCALTCQPWETPVCLAGEGLIYDQRNLEAFLKKYGVSPASGKPASKADIVLLHLSKNERGNFQDPVSFREFTDHSHLVAIRPSGNVYLHDTVQQLNVKARLMRDLVSDEPFQKDDIIKLQDPHDPEQRRMQNMHHIQSNLSLAQGNDGEEINAGATGSTKRLLSSLRSQPAEEAKDKTPAQLEAGKSAPEASPSAQSAPLAKVPDRLGVASTGMTAASFTSTSLTPRTKVERVAIDEEQLMFEHIASKSSGGRKLKGLVRMLTNYGTLNIELHVDKAPKTCYNFLMLCRQGTYDDTIFHRNIPGFMIQGGDPTGTGRGGQSIWGKPFWDELINPGAYRHTDRGVLSMANKGPNTNGSQFFFTYRATPHLDTQHTVFGHLISDHESKQQYAGLDALESIPTEQGTDRPLKPIRILETQVFEDPFEVYRQERDARYQRENPDDEERARREAKRRKREDDRTTWLGTRLNADADGTRTEADRQTALASEDLHGLKNLARQRAKTPTPAPKTKRRTPGGFGDFSGW